VIVLALLLAAVEGREALGAWQRWGAFRDPGPRCFAVSLPVSTGGRGRGFASVVAHFGRTRRAALYVRLSAPRNLATPLVLAIGERRFTLAGNEGAGWAPDAAADRAIVGAMRGARSMSVAAVSARGTPFADSYALPGAATAIDAAALGCSR
jgi:hypothetical protein